jgi:hypothetical protein
MQSRDCQRARATTAGVRDSEMACLEEMIRHLQQSFLIQEPATWLGCTKNGLRARLHPENVTIVKQQKTATLFGFRKSNSSTDNDILSNWTIDFMSRILAIIED